MKIKAYKKDFDYTYTLGVFETIELLKNRPDLVLRVYIKSNSYKNKGIPIIDEICREKHIELIESDNTIQKLSKKDKIYFNTVNETDEYVINFPTSTANEYNYLTFDELIKYDEKYNYIGIPFAKTSDNKYIVPIGADYVDLTINSYINNLGR